MPEIGAERRRISKILLRRLKEDLRPVNTHLLKVVPSLVREAPQKNDSALLHACAYMLVECRMVILRPLSSWAFSQWQGSIPASGWWEEELDPASRDLEYEDHDVTSGPGTSRGSSSRQW
ncbi:MAG: hypothetical protein SGPRY_006014 [Prymnesium sp.]